MMNLLRNNKYSAAHGLLTGHFIEVKALYLAEFNAIPCVAFVGELDITKAFGWIRENYRHSIRNVYQHIYWEHSENRDFFNSTIFVFNNKRMVEVAGNYCQILYAEAHYDWAMKLIRELAEFYVAPAPAPAANVIGFVRQSEMN